MFKWNRELLTFNYTLYHVDFSIRDILAELSSLPPSNVTQYQTSIMYPIGDMVVSALEPKGPHDNEMLIYSSQIWMRVLLNEAHNALYGASKFLLRLYFEFFFNKI